MSLESQVAALVTASNELTNTVSTKQASIDAAVAAAVAAVPKLEVDIYVDNVAGLDNNSGDINNPVKTIDEALRRIKPSTTIYLQSGQTHTLKTYPNIINSTLVIRSYGAGVKPILNQLAYTDINTNTQRAYGIVCNNSSIKFIDLNIQTAINNTTNAISFYYSGIVSTLSSTYVNIVLQNCDVLMQDFKFFGQSNAVYVTFSIFSSTIDRLSPAGLTPGICELQQTGVGAIAQASSILLSSLTWPDLIPGITKDVNGALRNITTSIASL